MYKILQVCPTVVIVVAILLSYSNNILKESNYHKSIYIFKKKRIYIHICCDCYHLFNTRDPKDIDAILYTLDI